MRVRIVIEKRIDIFTLREPGDEGLETPHIATDKGFGSVM